MHYSLHGLASNVTENEQPPPRAVSVGASRFPSRECTGPGGTVLGSCIARGGDCSGSFGITAEEDFTYSFAPPWGPVRQRGSLSRNI